MAAFCCGGCRGLDPCAAIQIQQLEGRTRQRVEVMADRWRGKQVAVVADPAHGAGLVSLLFDLGFDPVLVGLKGTTMGGEWCSGMCWKKTGIPFRTRPSSSKPEHSMPSTGTSHRVAEGKLEGVLGVPDLNGLRTRVDNRKRTSTGQDSGIFHARDRVPVSGLSCVLPDAHARLPRSWRRGSNASSIRQPYNFRSAHPRRAGTAHSTVTRDTRSFSSTCPKRIPPAPQKRIYS